MWDGDTEAAEAGEGSQERPQLIHEQRHVDRIDAGSRKGGVVQGRAPAVSHRLAHNAKYLQVARSEFEKVQVPWLPCAAIIKDSHLHFPHVAEEVPLI